MSLRTAIRTAHRWIEANAFAPYAAAYDLVYRELGRRAQAQYLRPTSPVQPLRAFDFGARKTSDTVFILGSGSSVNRYTAAEWARIEAADSIGFNSWLIHDFVPTYYVVEPHRKPFDETLYALLAQRAEAYEEVPVIIKPSLSTSLNLDRVPDRLTRHLYAAHVLPLPGNSREHTEAAYRRYASSRLDDPDVIAQKRSSVDGLIYLAARWNYRNIVLCGIDLNNTTYFYEEKAEFYRGLGRTVPVSGQTGIVHRTMDPNVGHLTADVAIYAVRHALLEERGIKLWTALPSSALHPTLPTYFDR